MEVKFKLRLFLVEVTSLLLHSATVEMSTEKRQLHVFALDMSSVAEENNKLVTLMSLNLTFTNHPSNFNFQTHIYYIFSIYLKIVEIYFLKESCFKG